MKEQSLWESYYENNQIKILEDDIKCDVLIIGGGITGLLCAYELKKRNINYVLVEKDKVGNKTTLKTTAFITAQHEVLYQDLLTKHGIEKTKEYLNINLKALNMYKELSEEFDFDYKECNSYMYSSVSKDIILQEKITLDILGYKANVTDNIPLNINIKAAVSFNNQATINPIKLVNILKKQLNIFEFTMIDKIKGNIAYTTTNQKIKFNKVIIATHYPINNYKSLMFAKLTQRRSYVAAIKGINVENTYCSVDENGFYFRGYKDYLIIGGNDRNTKYKCINTFKEKINELIPDKNIDYLWSGQDCITIDDIPYIGKVTNNQYIATGFHLWGFTWAMASSFIIADEIENKHYYQIVSPNRFFIKKRLFINILTTFKNLVSFKTPRCSHMKSSLNYNELENTFECPCHGSRFDKNGKVIDGPAKDDIKLIKED